MIWALAGGGAALLCAVGALVFWALRQALRRGAADTAARLAGMEALLQEIAARPAPLAPEALEDLTVGLKDDLAVMFTYAGRLAAIAHEESDRVIACINALHGLKTPAPTSAPAPAPAPRGDAAEASPVDPVPAPDMAAEPAPGLEALALEDLDADQADADPAFDVDNLGTPDWATEDGDAAEPAEPAEDAEAAFDVDNLGTPDWATEDGDAAEPTEDAEAAFDVDNLGTPDWATEDGEAAEPAEDAKAAFDVDNLGTPDWATGDGEAAEDAPIADAPDPDDAPETDESPAPPPAAASADISAAAADMLAAQQQAADRIEARLESLAAGIMALSASTDTAERLDAIAAAGDTRIAMLTTLSKDVGAGLAALNAGQTALRDALGDMGGAGADVTRIADALAALQARTETLSHAVDAAAGAVDEAAEAAAAAVLAAAQDRAAEDEARLQALCDRIAGLAGGQGASSGDGLGALSAQVDGLQARVSEMAELAAMHRDALARVEEAVTPDRLRLALDGAAEKSQAASVRRAASRIVDMPALDTPPRPPKAAAGD